MIYTLGHIGIHWFYWKLRVIMLTLTALVVVIMTGELPAQGPVTRKMFLFLLRRAWQPMFSHNERIMDTWRGIWHICITENRVLSRGHLVVVTINPQVWPTDCAKTHTCICFYNTNTRVAIMTSYGSTCGIMTTLGFRWPGVHCTELSSGSSAQ